MTYMDKILIVDDNPRMCDSLKALLSNQGYQIQTSNTGKDAVEFLGTNNFDLVLLDMVMPDINGHQIMHYINSQRIETMVIVITGQPSMESAIESLRRGAYDYLRKPFEPEELLKRVENALNKKRLEREKELIQGKLTLTERRYQYLVDNSPDIIYTLDHEGKFTFINNTLESLLGFKADQLIGNYYAAIVFEDDLDKAKYHFNERRTGKRATASTEIRLKYYHNGNKLKPSEDTYLIVELKAMGMYDRSVDLKDKKFLGTYGVARDITARKLAEKAVLESEKQVKTILNSIQTGIAVIDTKTHKIVDANPAAVKMIGTPRNQIIGRVCHKYICPAEKGACPITDLGQRMDNSERIMLKANGEEIPVLKTVTHIMLRGKECLLCSFIDMTEKKRLEVQLLQAQKMEAIGTLAGGIAHDFNNLLMGIQGNASLMLLDIIYSHPNYQRLKSIEQLVQSGADLTRQLLGFAMGGKYEAKLTNLNELIEKSSSMFARTKKEITVRGKYAENLWAVEVDRGQIEQVMLNLYVNAWQAMPGGGELSLKTTNVTFDENYTAPYHVKAGNYVKVSVNDSGVGMDEATQQRIFEPFFTTKEMGRGTGLGLASVYGIIKNHGGIITVNSKKGEGTTLNIYLPASEKELTEENWSPEEVVMGKETILLVDDEDIILDVGGQILKRLGYETLLARSGKEAIELCKANKDKIDLVILDMIMPDMGGGETYDRLKEIGPNVKVLLSSGYSIDGQATEILEKGCNGFIQKPFSMKQLSQEIREILDKK